MDDIVLKIDNVSKMYKLGQIGGTTLRDEIQRLFAKIKHKDDPTRVIGTKKYRAGDTFLALDGVSFEVKRGERVGIIGHNGAGKSTLLKLISRITAPTSGTIELNGRVASMLEVGTGFHPELTGRENIYMNGAILGMTKKEIDSKMEDIIEFSECRQFIDTPVKRYSSGMYVKLAFSVAAHLDSEIMIMDEVLAVGDMAFQKKSLDKMGENARNNRTILYVSHNMSTVRQLCNRCVVLDHGKVAYVGGVEQAIEHYMGLSGVKMKLYADYSKYQRTNVDCEAMTQSVEMLHDSAYFDVGSKLRTRVKWTTSLENRLLHFRILLQRADSILVGMAITPPLSYETEKENTTTFEWDISTLAPGRYLAQLLICEINESGMQVIHDRVNDAICFEIYQNQNDYQKLQWRLDWGPVGFPTLKIIE